MADAVVGENSPEHVAYKLMQDIARVEDKLIERSERHPEKVVDRKWILDTYAACIAVVRGNRKVSP